MEILLLASRHASAKIKNTSNVAKIPYQKLRLENISMKTLSYLEKLQDSSKSSEQLAEVNKGTHSINKIDFEKGKSSKQGLRQKKTPFSDSEDNFVCKGISKYGYGRWTSILMILASNFTQTMTLRQRTINFN